MYLNLDKIYGLHLELTSRCNLYCPQCARTIHYNYPLDELDLTTLKSLFNGFSPSLILICGNYGDSITYSDLHSAIDIFKNSGVKYTRVYTNGSARNSDWWTTLGEQLSLGNASGEIVFSIDGLEDTNHIYRKNSSWPIIMNSVKKAWTDFDGSHLVFCLEGRSWRKEHYAPVSYTHLTLPTKA